MDYFTNPNILFFIAAYLIGSIPFGLLLAQKFAHVNIKNQGSKSIGATNVLRVVKQTNPTLAKKLSIATIILDALKAIFILLVAMAFDMSESTLWGVAVLAVLGHCYSAFLGLEGGKGVATGLGVFAVMIPLSTLVGVLFWAFGAKVLKISSIASLLGLVGVISAVLLFDNGVGVNSNAPVYIISFIILYKHIPNIIRFVKGQEQKVV